VPAGMHSEDVRNGDRIVIRPDSQGIHDPDRADTSAWVEVRADLNTAYRWTSCPTERTARRRPMPGRVARNWI